MSKQRNKVVSLPVIEPNAAGIDVGATEIFVAVPADRDPEPIRCFPTFTVDLERLADWLDVYKRQVDRRSAETNLAFDSGSTWLGIDVVFSTGTNAAGVQGRAIRATTFR